MQMKSNTNSFMNNGKLKIKSFYFIKCKRKYYYQDLLKARNITDMAKDINRVDKQNLTQE